MRNAFDTQLIDGIISTVFAKPTTFIYSAHGSLWSYSEPLRRMSVKEGFVSRHVHYMLVSVMETHRPTLGRLFIKFYKRVYL